MLPRSGWRQVTHAGGGAALNLEHKQNEGTRRREPQAARVAELTPQVDGFVETAGHGFAMVSLRDLEAMIAPATT